MAVYEIPYIDGLSFNPFTVGSSWGGVFQTLRLQDQSDGLLEIQNNDEAVALNDPLPANSYGYEPGEYVTYHSVVNISFQNGEFATVALMSNFSGSGTQGVALLSGRIPVGSPVMSLSWVYPPPAISYASILNPDGTAFVSNHAPDAVDDFATSDENNATAISVLGNDTDPDASDSLTVSAASVISGAGAVTVASDGRSITYNPGSAYQSLSVGEKATALLSYTVSDGHGATDTAGVTITVTGVNDGPNAADDIASTNEDSAVAVAVLGNDSDPDASDSLAVSAVSITSGGGSVAIAADGKSITYDPGTAYQSLAAGEHATVKVGYAVSDGHGGTDTAEVTITVNGVNDAPVSVASELTAPLGACASGAVLGAQDLLSTDAEGAALTYTVTSASLGRLMVRGELVTTGATFTQADINAGLVSYIAGPVGPSLFDSFTFAVADGDGAVTLGSFEVAHAAYANTQIAPQWGGYWGGEANDHFVGTATSDNMSGDNGCDLMIGAEGDDGLHGAEGNNRAFGGAGNDNLTGGSGNDLFDGGTGDDQLHANGGNNVLFGGEGRDNLTAGEGGDRMWGGDGQDTINAGGGNNRIDAGAGDDQVHSGGGGDVVIGGAGNDTVYDNGGANTFKMGGIAGAVSDGNDAIWTGSGADKFALYLSDRDGNAAGWGSDTINGFRMGQGDQLLAFNSDAGFWDDSVSLGELVDTGFISGARSADGGDLLLSFGAGAEQSSLTLKWFFWDNSWYLSAAEKATANGQAIGRDNLVGILQDAIADGGQFGVSGPDFLAKAHDYISSDFML